MAKLHSDRFRSISINGVEYGADRRGVFDVPDFYVGSLTANFGMTPAYGDTDESDDNDGNGNDGGDGAPVDYALMSTADLLTEAARLGVATKDLTRRKLIAALNAAAAAPSPGGGA